MKEEERGKRALRLEVDEDECVRCDSIEAGGEKI